MIVSPTLLRGVYELELTTHTDERGFFARLYCEEELAEKGIDFRSTQINLSRNSRAGTLRGIHYQNPPFAEAKIVRVVQGRAYDVIVDLRPEEETYGRWISFDLDAEKGNAVVIPEGCGHGFMTLSDDTDVLYQMGRPYVPGQAQGYRYDDQLFDIRWPRRPAVISGADLAWPRFAKVGKPQT